MNQENHQNQFDTTYRRGVFVLVWRFPSHLDSYFVFSYKGKTGKAMGNGDSLALFNELQRANEYIVNLRKNSKDGNNTSLDFLATLEVLDQAQWNAVCKVMLAEGKIAVINPCEDTTTHRCPLVFVDLTQYGDLGKLKDVFLHYPNTHINIQEINNEKTTGTETLIFFDPQKYVESIARN